MAGAPEAPGDAVHRLAHLAHLAGAGDHRQQNVKRAVLRRAQHGGQLRVQQLGDAQRQADRAQTQRRIDAGAQPGAAVQRISQLVAAHVQRAHRDRAPVHGLDQAAHRLVLLVLVGRRVAVHVHEFAAQQADAVGADVDRRGDLAGQVEIGLQADLDAVAGHRRQVAQPRQATPAPRQIALAAPHGVHRRLLRTRDQPPRSAVQHHRLAATHLG